MRFGGLIAAVMFAAVAAIIVLRMSGGESSAPQSSQQQPVVQEVKTVNIYVAARAIPVGTVITQDMIATQPWPEHMVLEGFMKSEDATKIVGLVSRAAFQKQEPIIATKLSSPSDPNFLAGELPKGMRVITILTNEVEGLAGFVFPGDRVDVILTHDVDKWTMDPVATAGATRVPRREKSSVTETLLTNVKVMAVDQRSSNAGSADKDGKLFVPRSVSLMVSQEDAQRLRLGQKLGTLTLSLRALADQESSDPLTLTAPADITQWPDEVGDASGGDEMTVVRGVTPTKTPIISPEPAPAKGSKPKASPAKPATSAQSAAQPKSN